MAKKNVRHFSVETPYLAAVVKGTQFTVAVQDDGTDVSVHQGVVEVTDKASGQVAQVRSNQKASVSRSAAAGIQITGSGVIEKGQDAKERLPDRQKFAMTCFPTSTPASARITGPFDELENQRRHGIYAGITR